MQWIFTIQRILKGNIMNIFKKSFIGLLAREFAIFNGAFFVFVHNLWVLKINPLMKTIPICAGTQIGHLNPINQYEKTTASTVSITSALERDALTHIVC